MDTDPNPFRYAPDDDRSATPTEAPSDDATDANVEEAAAPDTGTGTGSSGAHDGEGAKDGKESIETEPDATSGTRDTEL